MILLNPNAKTQSSLKRILSPWLIACILSVPFNAIATPPTPPAVIYLDDIEIKGRMSKARGKISLPIKIRIETPVKAVSVTAILMKQDLKAFKTEHKVIFEKKFDTEKVRDLNTKIDIAIPGPGHYIVDVKLRGGDKQDGFSHRKLRHITVNQKGRYIVETEKQYVRKERQRREKAFDKQLKKNPEHPNIRLLFGEIKDVPKEIQKTIKPIDLDKNYQIIVRPTGPSARLRKYTIDKQKDSWSAEDPITVKGNLVYIDYDGVGRPLVNVSVNLWDEDIGLDEHLGVTATDWNGNWAFSVNNNDGVLADGRDIYYTFKLENTRLRVQDCDLVDTTYEWTSAVHDNLSDGTVLNFGTQTGLQHPNSMQVWSQLNLAWVHAVGPGGQDPGFVDSCFPEESGTKWDTFWEEVDIEAEYHDGPDVVTHEYAHAIMWYAYDDDDPSPGGDHNFGECTQNRSLSWSEGWATGFMLSARPDGFFNWHEGDSGANIENFHSGCKDGVRNEGRVAAALNDMRDDPDDCNGGDEDKGRNGYCDSNNANRVPLSTMLHDTLWGGWHEDIMEYWSSLVGELPGVQRPPAHEIMYYNWMPVSEPSSCVATKIVAKEAKRPEDTLNGLRQFRNLALKDFGGGRRLINLYYRNSPELALLLLKDKSLRQQALGIIEHFSKLGEALGNHREAQALSESGDAVIPKHMMGTIEGVLRKLQKEGSSELQRDIAQVRFALNKIGGLTLSELQDKIDQTKYKRERRSRLRLQQSQHNPESKKALQSEQLKGIVPAPKPPLK